MYFSYLLLFISIRSRLKKDLLFVCSVMLKLEGSDISSLLMISIFISIRMMIFSGAAFIELMGENKNNKFTSHLLSFCFKITKPQLETIQKLDLVHFLQLAYQRKRYRTE